MGKILLVLSLISLLLLGVGTTFYPGDPVFWLASGSSAYQHIREILSFVLVLQLLTRPPRHLLFRLLAGVLALAAGSWTIEATYASHMAIFDSLCFLSAAFAIGITALERKAVTPGLSYLIGISRAYTL